MPVGEKQPISPLTLEELAKRKGPITREELEAAVGVSASLVNAQVAAIEVASRQHPSLDFTFNPPVSVDLIKPIPPKP